MKIPYMLELSHTNNIIILIFIFINIENETIFAITPPVIDVI